MPLTIAYPLDALLMIAVPIALGVFLSRRWQFSWKIWWMGAATFVLSQVGHIPFNAGLTMLFNREILPTPPQSWNPLFNAIILGLSAGLWEEGARYATYRWWAKDARTWRKGIWLGAGHGGVEAILLGAILLINFFYLLAMRNTDLSKIVPPDQLALAQSQVNAFWSAPWYLVLIGALERVLTQPIQIALSVLVLQVFARRRIFWLFVAIGWHALVNAGAVYIGLRTNPITAEVTVAVASCISLILIFLLRKPEPEPEDEIPPPPPLTLPDEVGEVNDTIETPERLDQTRYQ